MVDLSLRFAQSTSEESDSRNYIIAPVPTKPFLTFPRMFMDTVDADPSLAALYKDQHSKYVLTYRAEVMIRRLSQDARTTRECQAYPIVKLLVEIACDLMMSEIEIAGFSIYLRRFVWPNAAVNLAVQLYAVGFAAKFLFSSHLEPLAGHLKDKIPGFAQYVNAWMSRAEEGLKIDMCELNKMFSELVKLPFGDIAVDCNYYVDSILEMAPASVYEKAPWQEQLLALPPVPDGIPELPGFMRLDSVLQIPNDNGVPGLERFMSTASNGSWFNMYPDLNELS
jgi:hypothetical protein